ncbi:MAG: hypothetical protein ACI4TT_00590, partial [Christensenellales bacterium]
MENKKISIKDVFNQITKQLGADWQKILLSSLLQFGVFLLVFLLTKSLVISLASWFLFLPTQTMFVKNSQDENVKVEHVFKLGSGFLTYLLVAILCAISYVFGFALAIVPAIIFFVNYAFVFEYAKDNDLLASFKKSHETAKGYRPKLFGLGMIFLFILLILIAFCILIAMLVGLCLHTNSYMLYVWGSFAGFCLFLIFVNPVMILALGNLKKQIEKDRLLKAENDNTDEKDSKDEQTDEDAEN